MLRSRARARTATQTTRLPNHARLRAPRGQVLREHGVRVLTVREILAHGVEEHVGARVQLENLAMATLTYQARARCAGGAVAVD